jgi:glycine/D-amino acid oxidase-like deaminating enzyme
VSALRVASGAPFWLLRAGLMDPPSAALPESCDVAIVGAGITGALLADRFARAGRSVVVLERDAPTEGSTAVSTALLQYELDVELVELATMLGEARAVRAYARCADSIDALHKLAHDLDDSGDFVRCSSLYVASRRAHARRLRKECALRTLHGLPVEWLSRDDVRSTHAIDGHAALLTHQAASVDPVRFARAALRRATSAGAVLCARTALLQWVPEGKRVRVMTSRGQCTVGALIHATGYELPDTLPTNAVSLNSSYALVTQPTADLGPLAGGLLVWETARPYTYMRATPDSRILVGGFDVPFKNEDLRDALLPARTRQLERALERFLKRPAPPTAFAWAGTFGQTGDGLPRIGRMPGFDHVYAALGYGGNGIVFSQIATDILSGLIVGSEDRDTALFGFERHPQR